jgi:hypothetical protein
MSQGAGIITYHRLNETYLLSRRVPDSLITNVILPLARKMYWVGDVTITCPQTGYSALITVPRNLSCASVLCSG